MIVGGCAPYAKGTEGSADDGSTDADEGDVDDTDDVLGNASAKDSIGAGGTKLALPDPVLKALRYIVVVLVTAFRTYLRPPCVRTGLFDPIPPSSVEEALRGAREGVEALGNISMKSAESGSDVSEGIAKEIALIGESIDRIEKLSR